MSDVHGVTVKFVDAPAPAVRTANLSVIGVIGTAYKGAVNTPTLVRSRGARGRGRRLGVHSRRRRTHPPDQTRMEDLEPRQMDLGRRAGSRARQGLDSKSTEHRPHRRNAQRR